MFIPPNDPPVHWHPEDGVVTPVPVLLLSPPVKIQTAGPVTLGFQVVVTVAGDVELENPYPDQLENGDAGAPAKL
jgi:hypothetical protein